MSFEPMNGLRVLWPEIAERFVLWPEACAIRRLLFLVFQNGEGDLDETDFFPLLNRVN